MQDGVDAVGQDLAEACAVVDIADDQARAIRHCGEMAAREVVVDDHLVAGLDEVLDARRAHEAGSPDDEQLQSTSLPIAIGPPR